MAMTIERKVGLFFVISIVVLGVMIETGEKWNPFNRKVPYKTFLGSVTGLKVGDPVKLVGVDVGKIKHVAVLTDKVQIDFEVEPGTRIKTDTVAGLRLTNLLGGQFLGLSLGSPNAPLLEPGGTVIGKDVANIDIIVDNVSDLTKDAKILITELNKNQNEVMHKIAAILDDNRGNLRNSIANLNSITQKFDRGDGSLAMLLNDKALYNNANDAIVSIRSVTTKIDKGEGTIGKLVNDDALYADARKAIKGLNDGVNEMTGGFKEIKEVAGKINRGEGTLGKLVNEDVLYSDLKDASRNIKDITDKINRGEGTIGKLVNEDKLYKDATATLKKTEKAMEGLGDSGPISVLGSIVGTLF
ncbi:mce related protein [Geobacter sp. OR-1]|uniref:MlaD family protein n=1 Tax=Geobacter sp. OR-1 TaxID=1266765 RepID=UPI00054211D0|nr:MlaD family protein [Geobacter sp. OR-1]GAM11419.1 mce related protein [Geobacter sp. OR-1]